MHSPQQQLQVENPPMPEQVAPRIHRRPIPTATVNPNNQLMHQRAPRGEGPLEVASRHSEHITKIAYAVSAVSTALIPVLSYFLVLFSRENTPSMLSYSLIGDSFQSPLREQGGNSIESIWFFGRYFIRLGFPPL